MTLYMVGIGLNDPEDITYKGLKAVEKAGYVYLENYTSKLNCSIRELEDFYNKKIILADRGLVEKKAEEILDKAKEHEVAFLVVGDVFSATTHTDLFLRAKKKGIKVKIINNASILTAVGITGLELYKFGKTTSIPFENKNIVSPYEAIKNNKKNNLHTLILLDIDSEKNKYMTVNEAIKYLLEVEKKKKEEVFTKNTMVVGCARLGGNYKIKHGTASVIEKEDFGKPLHCLIVLGKLHFVEEEALNMWK